MKHRSCPGCSGRNRWPCPPARSRGKQRSQARPTESAVQLRQQDPEPQAKPEVVRRETSSRKHGGCDGNEASRSDCTYPDPDPRSGTPPKTDRRTRGRTPRRTGSKPRAKNGNETGRCSLSGATSRRFRDPDSAPRRRKQPARTVQTGEHRRPDPARNGPAGPADPATNRQPPTPPQTPHARAQVAACAVPARREEPRPHGRVPPPLSACAAPVRSPAHPPREHDPSGGSRTSSPADRPSASRLEAARPPRRTPSA